MAVQEQAKKKKAPLERLFVPAIGVLLKLRKPWTFDLYDEYRNSALLEACGFYDQHAKEDDPDNFWTRYGWGRETQGKPVIQLTLPRGVMLRVERIYVRNGADMHKYNSMTFRLQKKSLPKSMESLGKRGDRGGMPGRFWVKLGDANNIVCEVVEEE